MQEAIQLERETLADIAPLAHRIDTSDLSASALRLWIKDLIGQDRSRITLLFESFGFKHGIPLDADMVFDVRCLPNPHYVTELRPLTGRDQPIKDYLEASPDAMALAGGHPRVCRELAALFHSRSPRLSDGGHRLHRWPAS